MSIASTPAPTRLQSLQALRAIAALLVVVFHSALIWRELSGAVGFSGPWDQGWAGVDLFFVISGFVMVWVAGDRAAGVKSAVRFWFDRATRVYPLWWVFCSLMALYFLLVYGQPASPVTQSAESSWGMFARSMLLWPQGEMPVLVVGWTLIFELAFYGLFGVLLLVPAKFRPLGLAVWAAILIYRWNFTPAESSLAYSWHMTLADQLCMEFLIGAAVAYSLKISRLPQFAAIMFCCFGVIAFLSSMAFAEGFDGESVNRNRVLAFGLPSGLILLGVIGWELSGESRIAKGLLHIGDASYTLYLSHFLVLLVLKRVFMSLGLFTAQSPLSMVAFMVVGLAASIIASLILYRLIERPLLRLARAPLAKRAASRQN
jgi:exopolysaccharide production protein ExoZ